MDCSGIVPAGLAKTHCITNQPTNLIIMEEGIEFTNYVDVENVETWKTKIQVDRTVYPTLDIRNVAPAKPSVNKETDGSGAEVVTRIAPGGAVVNLKTNACDFKEILQTMNGANYSIVIGLGSNQVLMQELEDGKLTGFTGQITAIPTGYPGKDAKLEEHQLDISWDNVDEWKNYKIITLPIFLKELVEETPLGLDLSIKTALSTATVIVTVQERCDGDLSTEVLTAEVTSYSSAMAMEPTATCTAVAATDGDYTIALSATPAAGQYVNFRVVKKTSTVYDKISNIIKAKP